LQDFPALYERAIARKKFADIIAHRFAHTTGEAKRLAWLRGCEGSSRTSSRNKGIATFPSSGGRVFGPQGFHQLDLYDNEKRMNYTAF
jgi:hypothetical protein